MTPGYLMSLGGFGSIAVLFASFVRPDSSMDVVLFGLAALFGKGYGIWEERNR